MKWLFPMSFSVLKITRYVTISPLEIHLMMGEAEIQEHLGTLDFIILC
jgi:hypothetical protein